MANTPARDPHDFVAQLNYRPHDRRDPDPWAALYLDRSIPMNEQAKAALILDLRSFSRRILNRVIKPITRVVLVIVGGLKIFMPTFMSSSKILHKLIRWGLEWFVSPQANFLILRHFHIGSEILAFIASNAPVHIETHPLCPHTLKDVEDDIFLKHDLNLYNFVIELNKKIREGQVMMHAPPSLNFDAITDGPFDIKAFPARWTNFLDVASAIEIYTPLYRFWLTDNDFDRANNSLQLDETLGVYVATLLSDPTHLALINNKHPLVPLSALAAGYRLVLHGLGAESLHALLVHHKRIQNATLEKDSQVVSPTPKGLSSYLGT